MEKQPTTSEKLAIVALCAVIGIIFFFVTARNYIYQSDRLIGAVGGALFLMGLSAAIGYAYKYFYNSKSLIYPFFYTFLIFVGLFTIGKLVNP